MQLVARITATVLSSLLYSAVFVVVALASWTAATWNDPSGSSEFFDALDKARADDAAGACGYRRAVSDQPIRLSHEDIVEISRCLQRRGYLTTPELGVIEDDSFEYTYYRANGRTVGVTTTFTVQTGSVPRWIEILWLAGLAVVTWLVGFRLPWWRSERTS